MGLMPLEFKDCLTDSPYFRQKLHSHEKELDRTNQALKGLIKDLNNVVTSMRNLSQAQRSLSSRLDGFSFECIGSGQTDDEILISKSLKEFAKLIDVIEDERRRIYNSSFREIIEQLEIFRKQTIGGVKEGRKKFEKETQKFYQSQDRYLGLSTKKDGQVLQEADASLDMEQRHFSQASLDYVFLLQEAQERKKFEFVEILLSHMYCWLTFYHQGHEIFNECTPYLRSLQERIQRTRENFNSTSQEASILKNKMLEIEDPGSMDKMYTRQGYLFLMEKKAFGTTWTKHHCQYQKETRVFTMIPYNQIQQKITTSETIRLKQCIRRAPDSIEKRFCFDLFPQQTQDRDKNLPQIYTLQALCEDDCKHWIDAMDGKEPLNMISGALGSQEATTLDEGSQNFIARAIAVLENKGLEDQGLYRLVGVSSKVNKLLSLGLDPAKCDKLVLEDMSEWETKTITSAIKQYFRNLPEPLMTYFLHSKFIAAAKKESLFERVNDIHNHVHELPEKNFLVLKVLVQHLCNVSRNSEKNLMTVSNLGVCFGPTLLRPEEESVAAIMDIKFCNIVVEILIEHCDMIFSSSPISPCNLQRGQVPPKPKMNQASASTISPINYTSGSHLQSPNTKISQPVVQTVVTSFTTSEPQTVHFGGVQPLQRSDGMSNLKNQSSSGHSSSNHAYYRKPYSNVPPPPSATHQWSHSTPIVNSGPGSYYDYCAPGGNGMNITGRSTRMAPSTNGQIRSTPAGGGLSFVNPLSEAVGSSSSSSESLSSRSSRDLLPPSYNSPSPQTNPTLGNAYPPTYRQHMETLYKRQSLEHLYSSLTSLTGSQSSSALPALAGACAASMSSVLGSGSAGREDVTNARRVRTLYACRGENDSELSFEPNQILTNVRYSKEPGWLEGTLNGKSGLIPENYVKVIDDKGAFQSLVPQRNTDV